MALSLCLCQETPQCPAVVIEPTPSVALSIDAVQKANSGPPRRPMGMADIAEVLWHDQLKHNPGNPHGPTVTASCCQRPRHHAHLFAAALCPATTCPSTT